MSERVVVDACLAAKWVLNEPYSPQAIALLQEWIGTEVQILAPALLATELANSPVQACCPWPQHS